jgi:branched-chain amino acid transport system permease protein
MDEQVPVDAVAPVERVTVEAARAPLNWTVPIKSGVAGGGIAVFLSMVGMVEASSQRYIIPGVLSLGQTLLLLSIIYGAYRAVQQVFKGEQGRPSTLLLIFNGATAGLFSTVILGVLVLIGNAIDLRAVFIKASPPLFNLITLGQRVPLGIILLLVVGAVIGAIVTGIYLLPDRYRRAVTVGLASIPLVSILDSALFAGSGLDLWFVLILFLVAAGASYLWSGSQATVKQRVDNLSPAGKRTMRAGAWVLAAAIVAALPLLGSYPSEVLDLVGIYALMGLGLNIVVGFAGLLDLGYVAFFALGAYTIAVLTSPEIQWTGFHLSFWAALPIAVGVATLAGVVLGIPVLGMRGDYLAIVTLGFGEIIRLVVLSDWLKPYIGGSNGITQIAKPTIGPIVFRTQPTLYYPIIAGCLIAAFVALRTKYSRLGRAWMAVREDEDVAQAMGIDLVRTKLLAFATGAAFAGLGGALFATKLTSTYPQSFSLMVSINVLCVVIVGGMGNIPGVIVGALFLVGLPEILREFSEYRLLMYGAALVLMMLKRPEGLLPEARRRLELHEAEGEGGE